MGLHKYKLTKGQRKLWFKNNKEKIIKIGTITMSVIVLVLGVVLFTMAKYKTNVDLDMIDTKVGNFSTGDLTLSMYLDGEKTDSVPSSSGHILANVICKDGSDSNVNVTFDRTLMKITGIDPAPKTKCNLYYQSAYKDGSGANYPELFSGLIPVQYDASGNTIYANPSDEWYSYTNHKWANAVLVDESIRSNYINEDGTYKTITGDKTIPSDKILQYYVWVPRYKYQLWNVNNESSDEQMINVTFQTTDDTVEQGSTNGTYLTHPAFTFGSTKLSGFWVGKFEPSLTDGTLSCTDENCDASNLRILPNVQSVTSMTVENQFYTARSIEKYFGLNSNQVDSHMMKNMEWGAVAYLSASVYGLYTSTNTCSNSLNNISVTLSDSTTANRCQVWTNPKSDYTTGCSGTRMDDKSLTRCTAWNDSTRGGVSSTTGNLYGIYDMSGGSWEYVMGNVVMSTKTYTWQVGSSSLTEPNTKYYDSYVNPQNSNQGDSHSNGRLGDATKEVLKTYGSNTGGWFSDYAYFPDASYVFFTRGGGYADGERAGVFYFSRHTGCADGRTSFRPVITAN